VGCLRDAEVWSPGFSRRGDRCVERVTSFPARLVVHMPYRLKAGLHTSERGHSCPPGRTYAESGQECPRSIAFE